MWIENVAAADVPARNHRDAGHNSMLISIADPAGWHPTPSYNFKEIHDFEFSDLEKNDTLDADAVKISNEDAERLVHLLQRALEAHMNVVVHCVAGICRSGAVCEIGVMMGFEDTGRFRNPNLLVKHKMMQVLGWTYDEENSD